MKKYFLKDNVDVIVELQDCLFLGSYEIENGCKKGRIIKVVNLLDSDSLELVEDKSIKTTGTFDIKVLDCCLLTANNQDITIYDKDLNVKKCLKTHFSNTSLEVSDTEIFVTDTGGTVNLYSFNLVLKDSFGISKDILWCIKVKGDLFYCGGEDGFLYAYNFKSEYLVWSISLGCGLVSICLEDDYILVGSYDEHIYKISYTKEIQEKVFIGGGVWKIIKEDALYILCCMYEGIKIVDKKFNLIKSYQNDHLVYSLTVVNKHILFNSFYERELSVVKL